MSLITTDDPAFRVCSISFETLIDLQRRAEDQQWGTRWTSIEALRSQVANEAILLMTFMREHQAIRCLVLGRTAAEHGPLGVMATLDVEPEVVASLAPLAEGGRAIETLAQVLRLAAGSISVVSKA